MRQQCAMPRSTEIVDDTEKGFHVTIERGYQSDSTEYWWKTITENARWHRVKYKSGRFGKACETPCWTTFFGGVLHYKPYEPVPSWLQPLVDEVTAHLGVPFNAMLIRLYFDGEDEIAWHTDGRAFLGATPTIASLSFGANATFQMRRMTDVWPPIDGSKGDCIDRSTPQRDFIVGDGDMLVMRSVTQKHWHHRVPKQKGRRPRLNINFRYIRSGSDAERGQKTYYKYMVHGDEEAPKSLTFQEIMAKRGGMMNFARPLHQSNQKSLKTDGSAKISVKGFPKSKSSDIVEQRTCKERSDDPEEAVNVVLSAESIDNETEAYLSSESDIDVDTFLSLPSEVRKELVNDWKIRKATAAAASKRSISATSSAGQNTQLKRMKRQGKGTIDSFFKRSNNVA
jgi:alkylated DNA repair dioxygenase AlkB